MNASVQPAVIQGRIDQGPQTDYQGKPSRTWQSRYPIGEPFETKPGEKTQVFVEVTSSHSKERKEFHSRATWVMVDQRVSTVAGREGTPFSVTRWLSSHAYIAISREQVARYSAKNLSAFHEAAVEAFEGASEMPGVVRVFEQAAAAAFAGQEA